MKIELNKKLLLTGSALLVVAAGLLPGTALAAEPIRLCPQGDSQCRTDIGEFCTKTTPPICQCRFGVLEIGLPFLEEFSQGVSVCSYIGHFGKDKAFSNFTQLIVTVLIALTIMSAMVVTAVAGYVYMTAGGNGDRVRLAKTLIGAALLGVFLALAAWALLDFISPSLTKGN